MNYLPKGLTAISASFLTGVFISMKSSATCCMSARFILRPNKLSFSFSSLPTATASLLVFLLFLKNTNVSRHASHSLLSLRKPSPI
jgi:hypothetical protein